MLLCKKVACECQSENMNWWIAALIYAPSQQPSWPLPLPELRWEEVLSHWSEKRMVGISKQSRILPKAWFLWLWWRCAIQEKLLAVKHWAGKTGDYWTLFVSAVPKADLLNIAAPPTPLNPVPAGKVHLDLLWQPLCVSDWVAAEKAQPEQEPAAKSFLSLASVSSSGPFS